MIISLIVLKQSENILPIFYRTGIIFSKYTGRGIIFWHKKIVEGLWNSTDRRGHKIHCSPKWTCGEVVMFGQFSLYLESFGLEIPHADKIFPCMVLFNLFSWISYNIQSSGHGWGHKKSRFICVCVGGSWNSYLWGKGVAGFFILTMCKFLNSLQRKWQLPTLQKY